MKEPSKKAIAQVKNKELVRIAEMHKVSVDVVTMVSDKVNSILPAIAKSKNAEKYYAEIEKYMIKNYGALYSQYKDMIVNSLNESGIEQRHLLDLTLGEPTIAAFPIYKTLPTSEAFKITNKILSEKSILKRSSVLAKRTTSIIAKSFDKGLSLPEITKKLDIEYGLSYKAGKITPANLQKIKEGKLVLRNGTIYQNERIARTEIGRMSKTQSYQVFKQVSKERDDARMKYQGTSGKRSRPNSISMNGQISDNLGTFSFPNGSRYLMHEAPAQYFVNCRCSASIVFIEDFRENDNNINELQTIEDINKDAKQKYAKKADFSNLPLNVAKELNDTLSNSLIKYPALKQNMQFVGESQARNTKYRPQLLSEVLEAGIKQNPKAKYEDVLAYAESFADKLIARDYAISERTLAQYSTIDNFKGITLNSKFFNNSDNIKRLAINEKIKFHPVGTGNVKGIIDHEIGHQLDDLLNLSKDKEVISIFNKYKNNIELATNELSKYSVVNNNKNKIQEFIAEAYSEYANNKTPRAIAKQIGEIINERYKNKFY